MSGGDPVVPTAENALAEAKAFADALIAGGSAYTADALKVANSCRAALAVRSDSSRDANQADAGLRERANDLVVAVTAQQKARREGYENAHHTTAVSAASMLVETALAAFPAPDETTGETDGDPFDKRAADRLAAEVQRLIDRGVLDSRSPAADALLDYKGDLAPAGPSVAPLIETREARANVVSVLVERLREEDGCAGYADGEACGECWNCRAWDALTSDEARTALAAVSVTPEPSDSGSRGALSSEHGASTEGADDE